MFYPLQQVDFDRHLVETLTKNGPRYTSYPTADRFHTDFGQKHYQNALRQRQVGALNRPLSLYVHVPFCNTICYYCGCNKIITKDKLLADEYIAYLGRELDLIAPHLHGQHQLMQLHFGGGTPTFLSDAQLAQVFAHIKRHFQLSPRGEYSIEIDPRKVSVASVQHLRELGFNRMSVGIQDFDPKVQAAVNRIQSHEETAKVIQAARDAGFASISVDVIYGLPHQTLESMHATMEAVLALNPDRLALYHYAHMPHLFKPQRRIDEAALPSGSEKWDILQWAVTWLSEQGYVFIGMDHFAKPQDELALALQQGRLQRNFQGYSTHADCDLLGVGVSSIGKIGASYIQNEKDLQRYYARIDAGELPVMRGVVLNADDLLRRNTIQSLMCQFSVVFAPFEEQFGMVFKHYFAQEWPDLLLLQQQGLLKIDRQQLTVTPKGRFLIRNIAMVFDRYLRQQQQAAQTEPRYSQTV